MNTVEKARQLAEPVCERLGLFLWDVRFEKEGALTYRRNTLVKFKYYEKKKEIIISD